MQNLSLRQCEEKLLQAILHRQIQENPYLNSCTQKKEDSIISNAVNDALFEEAQEYIRDGSISSTPMQAMLENDIKNNDLESLWQHVFEVRDMLREE